MLLKDVYAYRKICYCRLFKSQFLYTHALIIFVNKSLYISCQNTLIVIINIQVFSERNESKQFIKSTF